MKIDSPDVVHKTDVGGVALDLRTEDDVRSAFDAMMQRVRQRSPTRGSTASLSSASCGAAGRRSSA
jgi:acyl-CoA synthetase (NDP forming)